MGPAAYRAFSRKQRNQSGGTHTRTGWLALRLHRGSLLINLGHSDDLKSHQTHAAKAKDEMIEKAQIRQELQLQIESQGKVQMEVKSLLLGSNPEPKRHAREEMGSSAISKGRSLVAWIREFVS